MHTLLFGRICASRFIRSTAIAASLALAACGSDQVRPTTPGERVIFQDRFVEVRKPCPVKRPPRPAKLKRPLPTDLGALVDLLEAKLLEWDGPGKYGDQADAAIAECIKAPAG